MHELLPLITFYVFAGLTLIASLMVITQNNPVRCVLFLVLAFLCSSVLWILVHAEFLALILVLVYVGAVMTLFLFVVMMLNIDRDSVKTHFFTRYLPLGLILIATLTGLLMVAVPPGNFEYAEKLSVAVDQAVSDIDYPALDVADRRPVVLSNTENIGSVLYTDYVFAFELAAIILLVAIIAAITLIHRPPVRRKQQSILKQIMTRPSERMTLVKMKSEK
jgi:NADH-quinone oxidoreductase subunit J